jgi:DNA polymerase
MARADEVEWSAVQFLPARLTLDALRTAAKDCRGCPLFRNATQTVFGEGPESARVILVGEQPGNDEDLRGHPFVGPAGRVLDEGLERAGIDRKDTYVTNVVKHFKWVASGKRRLHQKPTAREVGACIPWLEKEIERIEPEVIVCLGATAAQALLGRSFRVTKEHGKIVRTLRDLPAVATVHPSSILRKRTSEERQSEMELFVGDLRVVAEVLA